MAAKNDSGPVSKKAAKPRAAAKKAGKKKRARGKLAPGSQARADERIGSGCTAGI